MTKKEEIPLKLKTYRFTLDLHKTGIQHSISAVKGDTRSIRAEISLCEGTEIFDLPSNDISLAILYVTKPDNKKITNECSIKENEIVVDFTPQCFAASGTAVCELKITDKTQEGLPANFTTPKFQIVIAEDGQNDEELISTDEFTALTNALMAAKEKETVATRAATTAELYAEKAIETAERINSEASTLAREAAEEASASAEMSADSAKQSQIDVEAIQRNVQETAEEVQSQADGIMNVVENHNSADNALAHPSIMQEAKEAKSIALGKARSLVFSTENDLLNWIDGAFVREDGKTIQDLAIGDNLYVVEINKPDYWWDGTAIQPLETEKPDLSAFVERTELEQQIGQTVLRTMSRKDYDAAYLAGTLDAGAIYFVYEE